VRCEGEIVIAITAALSNATREQFAGRGINAENISVIIEVGPGIVGADYCPQIEVSGPQSWAVNSKIRQRTGTRVELVIVMESGATLYVYRQVDDAGVADRHPG